MPKDRAARDRGLQRLQAAKKAALALKAEGAKVNVSQLAREFQVARTTLLAHINNPELKLGAGRRHKLTDREEGIVRKCLLKYQRIGRPLTRLTALAKVNRALQRRNCNIIVGEKWLRRFMQRNGMSARKPQRLSFRSVRAARNHPTTKKWYAAYKKMLDKVQNTETGARYKDAPHRVGNCDETGAQRESGQVQKGETPCMRCALAGSVLLCDACAAQPCCMIQHTCEQELKMLRFAACLPCSRGREGVDRAQAQRPQPRELDRAAHHDRRRRHAAPCPGSPRCQGRP